MNMATPIEQTQKEAEKAVAATEGALSALPPDILPLVANVKEVVRATMATLTALRTDQDLTKRALEQVYNGMGTSLRLLASIDERLARIEGVVGVPRRLK